MKLRGAVAIVTGAAAGAGRAIASRLSGDGASVVVADLDEPAGSRATREMGPQAAFVRADVREAGDVSRMIAFACDRFGGLDVLVNNAGGGGHVEPRFPRASPSEWGATLDLNLRGAMLATQLALEPMRERGGGAVVNIASSAGLGFASYVSPEYGAAKAGLIRFTTTVAWLREEMGVRVNCLVPGWIGTEREMDELREMAPEQRAAAPTPLALDEVADAVVELIRDEALSGRVMVMPNDEPRRLIEVDRTE